MNTRPQPSPVLAEILAQTGELDRILDGRGLSFDAPAPTPPAPPPGPTIRELMAADPPDWHAEEAERLEREREQERRERARIIAAELERIAPEDIQTAPAPKKRRGWRA